MTPDPLLPNHKTKIVATIGPASDAPEMLERLIRAGVNVARLNFSHGDFSGHADRIARIRAAAKAVGRRVAIMADLPGPKMRLGKIDPEPILLSPGDPFTLTADDIVGDARRVSMSFAPLPKVVKPGNRLFLNDGLVQLTVERVDGQRRPLRRRGRRRTPLPQGPQSAGHRSGHQRLHRPRPGLPGIRARAWRGRREPVVRRDGGGHRSRARGRQGAGQEPVHHRQDRAVGRARPSGRHSGSGGRHHGGARRSRGGSAHRADRHPAEATHRQGQRRGQAGHHGHADARIHDDQPPAHARRVDGRGQRHPRRHRRHHALGRIRHGPISRGIRGDAGEDRGLHGSAPAAPAGPRRLR